MFDSNVTVKLRQYSFHNTYVFSNVSIINFIMKNSRKYGFCIKTLHQKLQFTLEVNITGG